MPRSCLFCRADLKWGSRCPECGESNRWHRFRRPGGAYRTGLRPLLVLATVLVVTGAAFAVHWALPGQPPAPPAGIAIDYGGVAAGEPSPDAPEVAAAATLAADAGVDEESFFRALAALLERSAGAGGASPSLAAAPPRSLGAGSGAPDDALTGALRTAAPAAGDPTAGTYNPPAVERRTRNRIITMAEMLPRDELERVLLAVAKQEDLNPKTVLRVYEDRRRVYERAEGVLSAERYPQGSEAAAGEGEGP